MKQALSLAVLLSFAFGLGAATNQTFQCRVKVVDGQGQPVSGAVVERFHLDDVSQLGAPLQTDGRTTTDRSGSLVFTSTNQTYYILLASKPGLALTWNGWYPGMAPGQNDATLELVLATPKSVSGVVRDGAGKPVADAQVWVKIGSRTIADTELSWAILPARLGRQRFAARTGAEGKFRIDGLPDGAHVSLGVAKAGMALDRSHEAASFFNPNTLELEAGQADVVLTLKPAGVIEGRVVKAEGGAPVAGARVAFAEFSFGDEAALSTTSGADGAFRFVDLEAGQYSLQPSLGTNEPPDLVGEAVSVTVEAGVTNHEAKLVLGPGGLLEVSVKNSADEKPIAGAMVYAHFPAAGVPAKPVTSSATGIARFRLPPGEYTVFASKDGGSGQGGQATVELNKTNQATVSLTPPEAGVTVTGTVVDPAGKPVPEVAVTLFPFHEGDHKTDAQGHFQLASNPRQFGGGNNSRGTVIVRDLARNLAVAVELEEDATNLNLRLEPGLTLAGRVNDPAGKPITNALVTFMFHTEQMGSTFGNPARVDAAGRFEIKGLPAGRRYTVMVSAPGFGQATKAIEAADAEPKRVELEPFQLAKANLRLAGVVLDADDKPVAGAFVNGYGEQQPTLNGRTDAKGHFAFEHAAPGAIRLSANQPRGGGVGSVSAEGGDTNITLHLGSQEANFSPGASRPRQKLNGTVRDPDGKPASKVTLSLFPNYSNAQIKKPDETGHFVLTLDPNQFGGGNNQRVLIARDLERNLATALDLEDDATNADLRLEPGLTLAGRVSDAEGQPLTNAEATLTFWTAHMGSSIGVAAKADAQGRFALKGLPPGRRYGITVSARGFGQDNKTVEAADTSGGRVDLEPFQLAKANLRIAGVVLDADDKPVSGAYVNTFGGEKQPQLNVQSDAKGRFAFEHVCAGPINLSANSPRGGENGNVSAEGGDTNIVIHLGSQEANFGNGRGRPRQRVHGVVLDASGNPAAKIAVSIFPDFSNAQKKTDAEGKFVVTFDPNQFGGGNDTARVIIARDAEHNLAAALDVEEDATNATLKLAPGFTLAGHATGLNGQRLTNAQAQLSFRTPRMSSSLGQGVRVGPDGKFEIQGLPGGRGFNVSVTAPGYGQDSHNAETGEGENRRVELDPFQLLVADQRIAGVVLDNDDKPARRVYVYFYGDKQVGQSRETDAQGQFAFDKVCAGTLQVNASSMNGGGFANVHAEAGDTNIVIHLSNNAGRRANAPRASVLRGKPLPDLATAGLGAEDAPADRPVLVLLIDAEERPSRRVLRSLGEAAPALKQKGLAVVVLQSGDMAADAFNTWKQEAATPFPVGQLKQEPEKARAAWGAGALPWFILTDKAHKVVAEGFALEDLEAKISQIK